MSPATTHLLIGLGTLLALALCILVRPEPPRRSVAILPDDPPLPLGATWRRPNRSPCAKARARSGTAAQTPRTPRPLREYRAATDSAR
jgi:hypothetical protein